MVGRALLLLFPLSSRRVALVPASCFTTRVFVPVTPCVGLWGTRSTRSIHTTSTLTAGHNKWSKVKDVKLPRDAARGRMMAKLTMMIRVAVREGGSNPEFNVTLAQIVEQCRNKNVPKATIEHAIKGAEKSKGGSQHLFEVRGPGGFMALVEVLTENNKRTNQEIKYLLNKHGGAVCDGARHSFSKKGVVMANRGDVSSERALELAIEAGAEDVQETEDEEENSMLQFICGIPDMRAVREELEKLGVATVSSGLEYIATGTALLGTDQLQDAHVLLEALKDYPDVVRVWDNIEVKDS